MNPQAMPDDFLFDPVEDLLPKLPAIFKTFPNWVTWESVERKAPIISGTRQNASSSNPDTWVDYATACANAKSGRGFQNLGFVTDKCKVETGYLRALDLDGCRNPVDGKLADWGQRIVDMCGSYSEVTPSGYGLRVWIISNLQGNYVYRFDPSTGFGSKVQVEIFDDGKYFTVTGDALPGLERIVQLPDEQATQVLDYIKSRSVDPVKTSKADKIDTEGDAGFKKLFAAVGWKPLIDRLSKHPDSRFHNPVLEPGKLMYCPIPSHGPHGPDVAFTGTPFGVLKDNDAMVKCFACQWAGDMVMACNAVDSDSTGKLVAHENMYETVRRICRENNLRFEDFFPYAKTKIEPTQTGRTIRFVRGDSIKPTRLKWLWRGRILAGKLNVFSGEPDVGKGMTTVDFAARITRHIDFPDCKNELDGPKGVLLLSSEDDMEDTIVPRLIAAGADMTRIHFVQISENTSGTREEGIVCLDRDLPILEAEIRLNPDIVLIIPDPVIAFLGDADPNKDKEVRPIYSKMKTFAKRLNVAWLFVNHWNKNQNATSINKTSGAKTMVSAPRATWMFSRSPEDPTRFLMMKGKGNLSSGRTKTLAYRIVSVPFDFGDGRPADPDGIPKLVWDGETDHTCDEVLQDASEPKNRRSSKAEDLLNKLLVGGVKLAREIYVAGDKEGLSTDKMKRARYQLGYIAREVGNEWYWAKSEADILDLRLRVYAPAESITLEK